MAASDEVVSPEGDQGEQRQQGRRGAGDGFVGPLALGLDAEVAPNLFERHFNRPAPDEPAQDVPPCTLGFAGWILISGLWQGSGQPVYRLGIEA